VSPLPDPEHCYRAVQSRDARFDGWFITAVTSTGIYCRPSCPAVTPKRSNVCFYPTAAAAQLAGFRACLRCRPDAAPGSPEWSTRTDLVGRAWRLIGDGVIEREGVAGLSDRLGYSERHVHCQLAAELGAGPLSLARARRAQTARVLIETTALPFADVAFAAGFASVRQFNDTIREVYAKTPTALRAARGGRTEPAPGTVTLRLPYREPFDATGLTGFLAARAVAGVEHWDGTTYRRTLRLDHGTGTVALRPDAGQVACTLRLADLRDLGTAVARCRRLLDLDADPVAIDEALSADDVLRDLIAKTPGVRLPGAVDGFEIAVRAVVGQQVSVAAARTVLGRIVAATGTPLSDVDGQLTRCFPEPDVLAEADDAALPMPAGRRRTIRTLAAAVADGTVRLHPGVSRADLTDSLCALPGIGPWTAAYVAMRALSDPDVFLPTDLGIRTAATRLGLSSTLDDRSSHWRPWRSYAAVRLWQTLTAVPERS
jgi:AraC family transcriptional regulator, regulatory protein of adaptative response / DNA-3-methyladenine glycosylase II